MPSIIEKQGYKYTEEFGYIPEDWEVRTLGDIANIKDGTHQTPKYVNNGIPFYSVENITNNDFKNTKFISLEEHKRLTSKYKIEHDDVLMTRIGSIGDCKYIDWVPDASFYVSLALLKIKESYSAKYITQFSNTSIFKKELDDNSLPFAIPKKINLGAISNVRVILPENKQEQEKIAEVLGDVDSLIDKTQQLINKKKDLKTATMQKLLTPKEDWEVVPLSKYAYIFIGLVTTMTTNYVKNGVPLIRNSDIRTNKINKENLIHLDNKFAEEYNNRRLKIGDIVTVHTGDVGTSAIIDETLEGAIGFATLNTRVDKNKLLPQFLCWYFNSEKFTTDCLLASTGDGRQNLNLYDFIEFKIPVPSLEQQKQISDILNILHEEIETLEKELNKYKDLKTGMMQQLLTGKVRLI